MYAHYLKSIIDRLTATVALIVLLPILIFISIFVVLRLGRPIFFIQLRSGLYGKPFCIIKFRTMTDERDQNSKLLPDEVRLTNFGRFLRSTSLDELPELINVLRGEMSLVGPRPLPIHYLDRYTLEQARRHEVKPGITGWAQVNGRNAISWKQRFELDVWYVDNQSFRLDTKILFSTVLILIRRQGITEDGQATMSEFLGE